MKASLTMDGPVESPLLEKTNRGIVGSSMNRPEGKLKVSGTATYAHEWNLPGTAFGVFVRAAISKGRWTEIDHGWARQQPGVLGVFADKRFLRNPAQGMAGEAPVQPDKAIAYLGQPIALVVAETFEQARHIAQNIGVTYAADEDGVFDPEASNVEHEFMDDQHLDQGDLDEAMKTSAYSIDQVYRTPNHNSAAMEPHCSVASWQGDKLTLRGSYQMLKFNKAELADCLGIGPDNVRILSPYVGGGFGSKLGISPEAVAAAIASKELDRPVAVTLTRQQVFETTMRRSETRQRVRLASDKDGKLTGIGHDFLASNLPEESFLEPVLQATHFIYGGANRRFSAEAARLNRTCAGSVRAPGEAVGMQALEIAMDELAVASGVDPVELRLRNIPEEHPESDIPYSSRKFAEALKEGAERFGWEKRNPEPGAVRDGEWLIGMGMASAARVNMIMEAEARVTLNADGTALVQTDMTDIGTGTYAILTQIAAELLGLAPEQVEVRLGDTDDPPASGSGGSFGAASVGSAVYLACQKIREDIAKRLGGSGDDLDLAEGQAKLDGSETPLTAVLDGHEFSATGHIEPGEAGEKVKQATFGSYFAEVAVNQYTGETRVRRMHGTFGAGRILNRKTATSQCLGAMIWGIGIALTEELVFDLRDGHIVNNDLAEYHLAVNLDAPQIDVVLLDERDDWASPLQAKGIGELGICGAAAAVINAIYNATGVRVRDLPATLDKVIAELEV